MVQTCIMSKLLKPFFHFRQILRLVSGERIIIVRPISNVIVPIVVVVVWETTEMKIPHIKTRMK